MLSRARRHVRAGAGSGDARLQGEGRANYSNQKKRLYIELKAQRACNGKTQVTWYDEKLVARRMMTILKDFPTILQDITLTSFNPEALVEAHKLESELGGATMRYYLIVGGRGLITGDLICVAGMNDIPPFKPDRQILKETWLTGLWFAPTVLDDWASTLQEINEARGKDHPLRFGLSTYNYKWEDFEGQLASSKVRLENVESVIYDVCDGPECKTDVKDWGMCSHSPL